MRAYNPVLMSRIEEIGADRYRLNGSSTLQLYYGLPLAPPGLIGRSWRPGDVPGYGPAAQSYRPMGPTEVFSHRLDPIYPGLRILDKYHPPRLGHPDPSFEEIAGIKGKPGSTTSLIPKRPIFELPEVDYGEEHNKWMKNMDNISKSMRGER